MSTHKFGLSDHHDKFDPAEERADGVEEYTADDNNEFDQIPIRPRQRFTVEETEDLERTFIQYEHPTTKIKQGLADKFNTTASRVRIWFQNRRAKAKKMCLLKEQSQPDNILENNNKRLQSVKPSPETQSTSSSSSTQESSTRTTRKRGRQTGESQELSYYRLPPNITASSSEFSLNNPTEFPTSIPLSSSDRFMYSYSNRPDLMFRVHPRFFQGVQPYQQFNVEPAGYLSSFHPDIGIRGGNCGNNVSRFIDPQKISHSKEGEFLSRPMDLHNEIMSQTLVADDSIDGEIMEDFDETITRGLPFRIYKVFIKMF